MANYTATTSLTLEEAIAAGPMLDGDDLTITNGAKVTCTQTPSILMGGVNINDGEFHIDGENISSGNMINFVGVYNEDFNVLGLGLLRTTGDWYSLGTTNGSNNQSIDVAAYFNNNLIDAVPAIWIETGRRINFTGANGAAPEVDDWVYVGGSKDVAGRILEVGTNYLVVKCLVQSISDGDSLQVRKVVDNVGPDFQIAWNAVANGADIKEDGVYQEFGNAVENNISRKGLFGNKFNGLVFEHIHGNSSINLGDGVNGYLPPVGCDIRIPNVHMASSDTTQYPTGATFVPDSTETNRYNLTTNAAGSVDLSITNLGSVWLGSAFAFEYDCDFVGTSISIGTFNPANISNFTNSVICSDMFGVAYDNRSAFRANNVSTGINITDCLLIISSNNRISLTFTNSRNINVKNCIYTRSNGRQFLSALYDIFLSGVTTSEFNNNILYSDNTATHGVQVSTSTRNSFKNIKFSSTIDETLSTIENNLFNVDTSNEMEIIGLEFLGSGFHGNNIVEVRNLSGLKIRAVGMIEDKISFIGNDTEYFVRALNASRDIDIARCWTDTDTITNEEFFNSDSSTNGVSITNCSGRYNSDFGVLAIDNSTLKGLHAGNGTTYGVSNSIIDALSGSYGRQINDGFDSDTTGFISCVMITPSATINNVTVTAGNPKFSRDGSVNVASGDIFEIEQDYSSRGHETFTGLFTTVQGSSGARFSDELTNIDIDFQYDTGSGFNGSWLNIRTASNLTNITNFSSGIRIKFRLTCNSNTTDVSMIVLQTNTSLATQASNLHPIDQVQTSLTLNGIANNTEVRVYRSADMVELAGVENITDGTFKYDYTYSVDIPVYVQLISLAYEIETINFTLTATSSTIPVQQRLDRNYENN